VCVIIQPSILNLLELEKVPLGRLQHRRYHLSTAQPRKHAHECLCVCSGIIICHGISGPTVGTTAGAAGTNNLLQNVTHSVIPETCVNITYSIVSAKRDAFRDASSICKTRVTSVTVMDMP
jgi:hypothetical protein